MALGVGHAKTAAPGNMRLIGLRLTHSRDAHSAHAGPIAPSPGSAASHSGATRHSRASGASDGWPDTAGSHPGRVSTISNAVSRETRRQPTRASRACGEVPDQVRTFRGQSHSQPSTLVQLPRAVGLRNADVRARGDSSYPATLWSTRAGTVAPRMASCGGTVPVGHQTALVQHAVHDENVPHSREERVTRTIGRGPHARRSTQDAHDPTASAHVTLGRRCFQNVTCNPINT